MLQLYLSFCWYIYIYFINIYIHIIGFFTSCKFLLQIKPDIYLISVLIIFSTFDARNIGAKEDERDQIVQNVKLQVGNAEAKEKALEEKNKHDDAVQRERSSQKLDEFLANMGDEKRKKNLEAETKEKLKEAVDQVKAKTAKAYDEAKQHVNKASNVAADSFGAAKQKVDKAYDLKPPKTEKEKTS